MRSPRRLLAAIGAAALTATCVLSIAATSVTAASSCTNSFPSDGHTGPWFTGANGGTLHGNTLKISCPNQSTNWSVTYYVWKMNGSTAADPINTHRTGTGDAQWSISVTPIGCNQSPWRYKTQVTNHVTGGSISKPNPNGEVIC